MLIDVWNRTTCRSSRGKGASAFTFLHDVNKEREDVRRVGRLPFGDHVPKKKIEIMSPATEVGQIIEHNAN